MIKSLLLSILALLSFSFASVAMASVQDKPASVTGGPAVVMAEEAEDDDDGEEAEVEEKDED